MLGLTLLLAAFLGMEQAAPTTAQLTGKVLDRSGAALPGVAIVLEVAPPAPVRGIVSADGGVFKFDNVVPGTYTVKFELAGFLSYRRTGLVLAAGQSKTMTVVLDVGAPAVVSTVTGSTASPDPKFDLAPGEVPVGVETSLGTFYIAVDTKRAPITTANFLRYVDARLYDSGRF
ncbi:MAG: carboxypeptidase regulatory-like domain-containing protein, partial [Vicinamibacterales bacterium]